MAVTATLHALISIMAAVQARARGDLSSSARPKLLRLLGRLPLLPIFPRAATTMTMETMMTKTDTTASSARIATASPYSIYYRRLHHRLNANQHAKLPAYVVPALTKKLALANRDLFIQRPA